MATKIKLMPDYGCYPLWWASGDLVGNIDPAKQPLSQETINRLYKWAAVYNTILNWDDPLSSPGFVSPEVEANFDEEAIKVWKQLQTELAPNYEIVYFSNRLCRIVTNLGELKASQQ